MPPLFADVIFPDRISRPFTYRIPQALSDRLQVGQWIVAPLGTQTLAGFILAFSGQPPHPWQSMPGHKIKIREIQDVLTTSSDFELDPMLVSLAQWMSDYYLAPLGRCLQLIQPPRPPGRITSRITITENGLAATKIQRTSTSPSKLLTHLAKRPKGLTRSTLNRLMKNPDPVLARLKRQGLVKESYSISPPARPKPSPSFTKEKVRTAGASGGEQTFLFLPELSPLPSQPPGGSRHTVTPLPPWWDKFQDGLALNRFQEFFVPTPWARQLHVLGRSVEKTLNQGKSALLISPDINRASVIAECLRGKWGDQVGLFHGDLPDTKKQTQWIAMSRGQFRIVVGTRLSLFVPLPSLGLINLEDEEDPSFKDEQCPYYHARDVARKRAELSGATIFFQSRHPSLETYAHFRASGQPSSPGPDYAKTPKTEIRVVDLRQSPYGTILSHQMLEAVESALQAGGGIVLYVNRKGFSFSLLCRDCGRGLECPHCHVSLSMFKPPPRLVCAYCGYVDAVPVSCPTCASPRLEPAGLGTERVEEELRKWFPATTMARLDRNAVRTRQAEDSVRRQFCRGEIAILVGTQMLFHGDPLRPIRFIGIPYAESGLHIPDFRAAERLYQHLQEAIDLIPSEYGDGKVILQTRLPTHHAIEAVVQQKPAVFYEQELMMRQAIGYPPFTQLIQLSVSGTPPDKTRDMASEWITQLTAQSAGFSSVSSPPADSQFMVLGPIPRRGHSPPKKRHQYQILIKARPSSVIRHIVKDSLEALKSDKTTKGIQFGVNVDPVDML